MLRRRGLSPAEIADLLQKHIGDGTNPACCKDAINALKRIRSDTIKGITQVTAILLEDGNNDCEVIKAVIGVLRSSANGEDSTRRS